MRALEQESGDLGLWLCFSLFIWAGASDFPSLNLVPPSIRPGTQFLAQSQEKRWEPERPTLSCPITTRKGKEFPRTADVRWAWEDFLLRLLSQWPPVAPFYLTPWTLFLIPFPTQTLVTAQLWWNQFLPQIRKEPCIGSALTGQSENISQDYPNWTVSRAMRKRFFFFCGGLG